MTNSWLPLALLASLAGPAVADETPRVRDSARVAVVVAKSVDLASDIVLTGEILPQAQTDVSFRVAGRIAERKVDVGVHVVPDDLLARVDPQEQEADVQNAVAVVNSAKAVLLQSQLDFQRQDTLLKGGYATRSGFDSAQATLRTAQASLDAAEAALGTAREQRSYTDLKAGQNGVVTARYIETGQVVQAGQKAFTLAQDGPRDAVFNVYESVLVSPPADKQVKITLLSDPTVSVMGTVREIAPTVDAATASVQVKIGIADPPPEMTLGASVIGRGRFRPVHAVSLPWTALFRWRDGPALWVLDRKAGTVALRSVTIDRYVDNAVIVSSGVSEGETVVVAGFQSLRPGEAVDVSSLVPSPALVP